MSFLNKLFRKKPQKVYPPYISVVRYTKDVWMKLYPKSTVEEWKEMNCEDNVSELVRKYVLAQVERDMNILSSLQEVRILTIDQYYLQWLEQHNYNHSPHSIAKYTDEKCDDNDWWNQRYIESGMTQNVHVLGLSFTSLLINLKDNKTTYKLSRETTDQITDFIKQKYHCEEVFVPGWIIKGSDAIKYLENIETIAKEFFDNKRHIRLGQCEEQVYNSAEISKGFVPLPFMIPIVYKTNTTTYNHHIKQSDIGDAEKYEYAPNLISIDGDEIEKLTQIIASDVPGLVEVAPCLRTKERVAVEYRFAMLRKMGEAIKFF